MKMGLLSRFRFDTSLKAAQQVCDFSSEGTGVDMRLVDGDMPPVRTEGLAEQRRILRTKEEILEHRIVGEQDVGRILANLLAGYDFVRKLDLSGILFLPFLERLGLGLLGVAGVTTEGDIGAFQKHTESLELVVRKSVHRIENHGANASGAALISELFENVIENRQKEAFGLTRSSAGNNSIVAVVRSLLDGLHLVHVKRAVRIEVIRIASAKAQHSLAENPLLHQLGNSLALPIRWCGLQEGAFCQVAGPFENTLQLGLKV